MTYHLAIAALTCSAISIILTIAEGRFSAGPKAFMQVGVLSYFALALSTVI